MNKKDSINGFNGLEYQNVFGESDCSEHSLHHDLYVRIRDDINEKILLSVEQSINGVGNKSFESNVVISRQYIIDALNEKFQRAENKPLSFDELHKRKGKPVCFRGQGRKECKWIIIKDVYTMTVGNCTERIVSTDKQGFDYDYSFFYDYEPTEVKR